MEPVVLLCYFSVLAALTLSCTVWLIRVTSQLHNVVGPRAALVTHHGPNIGTVITPSIVRDSAGQTHDIPTRDAARTFVLYGQVNCPVCSGLIADLDGVARRHPDTKFVVLMNEAALRTSAVNRALQRCRLPVIVDEELTESLRLTVSPYGLLFDRNGALLMKGLVSFTEDVESLFIGASREATLAHTS